MNLADHLRPLLRDHDCVIIPDFGGLVAEYTPARVQPGGRHVLSPPTRQVAFNQALTRNDGLLVDALRQHVATLHRDLQTQQRTELPGIGVFRQVAGRGLQFEYTGTDNLFTAAFGLPELTVHPISVTDARLAREQQAQLVPRLRAAGRGVRLQRAVVVPGTVIGLLAGLAVAGLYLLNLHPDKLPTFTAPAPAPVASPATIAAGAPAQPVAPEKTVEEDQAAWARVAAAPAPAQTAPAQTEPVNTMLIRRSAVPNPVRPRAKARKVPAAAAIALADESNVAKPVPLALRKPGSPSLTTSYGVATTGVRAAAPAPASKPVVRVASGRALKLAPAKVLKPAPAKAPVRRAIAVAPPVAAPVALAPAGAAASAEATTIKSRTGRYYLIVAAYGSLARAEEGRRNLAHAGRPAKVILPPRGSRLYRLSAIDFADKPTATLAANRLRRNPHFDKGLTVLPY
jgi:hypothetical protein